MINQTALNKLWRVEMYPEQNFTYGNASNATKKISCGSYSSHKSEKKHEGSFVWTKDVQGLILRFELN